ncbi:hypothetical protein AM587_10000641 [Phytophthora nicotianae]|nr:hypothetical protein AM587_10000641 [Phytophthora nicotianae]
MTPGEVYKQLQLDRFNEPHFDKIENTVFGYLGFNTWVKYVDDFNEKNPTKKESMIPSLLTLYSDIDLSRVLEMAKKASTTEALARKLRMEQIQRWMTDGKTPGYVFKMFMVDSKVDELLTNPQFIAWTKYVDEFNAKNPANQASMIPPIVTHYGDDAVFGMLEAAKKVQSTEKLASKLQAEQIQKLLSSNHSPTYVFKALNLDKTGDEVFSTPLFTTWFNYLKTFNDKNPDKKESLLTSIHRYYQDHDVARIVEKAMTNPSTVKLANQLQDERYSRWLLNESSPQSAFYVFILTKPGADDVIRFRERPDRSKYLLPLEKVSDDLLSSPDFKRWAQYLDDFNAKYPDKQTSMSAVFRAYYTDDALGNMLAAARKDPSTRDIASTLEKALFNV